MNDLDVLLEVNKIMNEKHATIFNAKDVQEATKRIKKKEILRILCIVSISVVVKDTIEECITIIVLFVTRSNGTLVNTNAVLYLLEEYPTAYDPDKIVEQLEEVEKIMTSPVNKDCFGEECRASDCTVCLISKARMIKAIISRTFSLTKRHSRRSRTAARLSGIQLISRMGQNFLWLNL